MFYGRHFKSYAISLTSFFVFIDVTYALYPVCNAVVDIPQLKNVRVINIGSYERPATKPVNVEVSVINKTFAEFNA